MNLSEKFKDLLFFDITLKKEFLDYFLEEVTEINAQILRDISFNDSDKIELIKSNTSLILYLLKAAKVLKNHNVDLVVNLEAEFIEYSNLDSTYSDLLENAFQNTFSKLESTEVSWEFENDIDPANRYLRILDQISFDIYKDSNSLKRESYENLTDEKFKRINQEFKSIIKEIHNENILSVGISYSYANINLPKTYDIIFDTRDYTKFWKQKTIVKGAFNYRDIFHPDLWRGHHSHCLIEVIGDIPEIFNELPKNNGGLDMHPGIGLCTEFDWNIIKKQSITTPINNTDFGV